MTKAFVFLTVACLALSISAADPVPPPTSQPIMIDFKDLKWTGLPERPGMQFSVISGDPKTGAYTQVRRVPGGTDNALHTHSSELTNVVISGTWYTGVDASNARDFGPGSVILMPSNWKHVSGCRKGEDCVFYQSGNGKFDYNDAD
jgi:quercetin dioxygenase-like cupin family protein